MVQRNPSSAVKPTIGMPALPGGAGLADAVSKASFEGMRTAGRVQSEAMRFVAERLSKDLEMPARLARCQSVESVLEEQWKFTTTLMQDYGAESRRLLDMLTKGTGET